MSGQILKEVLLPGQRINEPDVGNRMDISRAPALEASLGLEGSGLVDGLQTCRGLRAPDGSPSEGADINKRTSVRKAQTHAQQIKSQGVHNIQRQTNQSLARWFIRRSYGRVGQPRSEVNDCT